MTTLNYTQYSNINNFLPQRTLLGVGNLNEADFADVLCSAIAPLILSGDIFPLYPVYCVRLYTVVSTGVGTLIGVVGGLSISSTLSRYLPRCACNTLSSIC